VSLPLPAPASISAVPFSTSDILQLATFGPCKLADGVDPDALASLFASRFREALDWVTMTAFQASSVAEANAMAVIAKAGRAMLGALGLPTDPETLASTLSNDDLAHAPARRRLENTIPLWGSNTDRDRTKAHALAQGGHVPAMLAIRATPYLSRFAIVPAGTVASIDDVLPVAPFAIAMIVALADRAATAAKAGGKGRKGRRGDNFTEVLFNYVAWCHLDMFGCLPETERNRGERDGRSVLWASEFLLLAAEKIPPLLVPSYGLPADTDRAVELQRHALLDASQLSNATVADRLAEGGRFVARHRGAASE
jgi:hypothetical protein